MRLALFLLLATACSPALGPLIDNAAWVEAAAGADPLADHAPEGAQCPGSSWYVENDDLEVFTGECDYLALTQPLLLDLRAGEPIEVLGFHTDLFADEPAQGHLALFVGDDLLFDYTVDIPAEAAVYTETVSAPRALDAGETVLFHLHNHGANTWQLVGVEAVGKDGG